MPIMIVTILTALFALPTIVIAIEIMVAITNRQRQAGPHLALTETMPVRTTILVPAHNEEVVIKATLDKLMADLPQGFDVLVVADNCTDATAYLASKTGAQVSKRQNDSLRGKGYALAHGRAELKSHAAPPDVVIVLDADCEISAASLQHLALAAQATQSPIQAQYLFNPSAKDATTGTAFATFAVVVKNLVRAKGLSHMGLSCQLMGTGMAFPWSVFTTAKLASGNIVEDMELGVALAMAGNGAQFSEQALVESRFPTADDAQTSQRTRWEHGHLQSIAKLVPKNLVKALVTGNVKAIALLIDLAVPPLSFFVMTLVVVGAAMLIAGLIGFGWLPFVLIATAMVLLILSIAAAWHQFGQESMSAHQWRDLLAFISSKLPIYARLAGKRQTDWVRTARDE